MIKKAGDQQVVALIEQMKVLQKRADEAAAKAKRDPRYQQTADDLAQQVRDTTASIAEAQATAVQNAQTAFQNQLDKALRPSAQRQQFADLANRNRFGPRQHRTSSPQRRTCRSRRSSNSRKFCRTSTTTPPLKPQKILAGSRWPTTSARSSPTPQRRSSKLKRRRFEESG